MNLIAADEIESLINAPNDLTKERRREIAEHLQLAPQDVTAQLTSELLGGMTGDELVFLKALLGLRDEPALKTPIGEVPAIKDPLWPTSR